MQPLHKAQWERFQAIKAKQRLPHALLLIGPAYASIRDFAYQISAAITCSQVSSPCGQCKSCHLILQKIHPDINYLTADKVGSVIKIDQIRELHSLAFRSPQVSSQRIIIIEPADKMNTAAANALLKLLEEPPESVFFFLITEQVSTLPATIVSRCQQWQFTDKVTNNYLNLGKEYSIDSDKGLVYSKLALFIDDLIALVANKVSVCALAVKWASYEFSHLLWLIYLINAQLIDFKLNRQATPDEMNDLYQLAQKFHSITLFRQLDTLNEINKKLQQNIPINSTLALENLLLGYSGSQSLKV